MTLRSRFASMSTMLGAVALSLTLALTGCGQGGSESTNTADTTEETTEEVAETTEETTEEVAADTTEAAIEETEEVTVPADLEATTKATATTLETGDTKGAEEFDALPTETDENAPELGTGDIEARDEEENKAASGWVTWTMGGIQMDIPIEWKSSFDAKEGYTFLSPDKTVVGLMHSFDKKAGVEYDVEALVKSVPKESEAEGFKDVKILAYDTLYSEQNNTLCGAQLMYSATYKGKSIVHFVELIESKSYLNAIEFVGEASDVYNYAEVIDEALETVSFKTSEIV